MKLIVTGGAGFIGSRFVEILLTETSISKEITELTVVDKLTYAGNIENLNAVHLDPRFKFVNCDINDQTVMTNLAKDVNWIVNFAAESHVDRSLENPEEFVQSNIVGVFKLLEIQRANPSIKFLQVSTDEVYGSIETGSWTEDSPLQPRSPYSASKASADMLALSYATSFNLDVRITRCSNNFGPRQHSEKMIPSVIRNFESNLATPIYGDGQNIRDWLYVDDHVYAIWLAMKNGKPANVYNIGGGIELTNNDLVDQIALAMDISQPKKLYVQDRKGHDFRYSLSYEKAKLNLGYEPRYKFHQALTAMLTEMQYPWDSTKSRMR
jgi:dTDP-glucose 4,6-dehydratase